MSKLELPAPTVSIVIPAYNRSLYLGRTIESVRAQTVESWELVISDDGSTDDTAAIADSYARTDPRIRVVKGPNGGVAEARNRGFAATDRRTRYVTFLDSDDRWFPDTLASLVDALQDREDLVAVYGLARCIDGDDQLVPGDDMEERMRARFEFRGRTLAPIGPDQPTTFAGMVQRNYPETPGLFLVRRWVMEAAGRFDREAVPAEDWDMAIRISRAGPIGFLEKLVLEWRRHPETLSGTSPRWRAAYNRVRAKSYTAPENTSAQRHLAKAAYLSEIRAPLAQGWVDLRGGRASAAARQIGNAGDRALRFGVAVGSVRVDRARTRVRDRRRR